MNTESFVAKYAMYSNYCFIISHQQLSSQMVINVAVALIKDAL